MERWKDTGRDSGRDVWRYKDLDTQQPDTIIFPAPLLVPGSSYCPDPPVARSLTPRFYTSTPPSPHLRTCSQAWKGVPKSATPMPNRAPRNPQTPLAFGSHSTDWHWCPYVPSGSNPPSWGCFLQDDLQPHQGAPDSGPAPPTPPTYCQPT